MKKIGFLIAIISLCAPLSVFAANGDTDPQFCHVPPDHGVYSSDGLYTLLGCITKADWDKAMQNQNTFGVHNLPVFYPGQTITDAHGISFTCPAGFFWGCVDMTGTQWYKDDMNGIAKSLIAQGYERSLQPGLVGAGPIVPVAGLVGS
jgi:hypothetical protein